MKFLSFGIFALLLASCSSDDNTNAPVNEEEVITTVIATFATQGGGSAVILTFRDLDGDGPNAPEITTSGNFATNTVYNASLDLLNETTTPAESITEEIIEEALDHQFFFSVTNNIGTAAYAAPFDGNAHPVGVNFTFTTTAAATGNLTVVLRHQPDKSAEGVANGDITNAGGETDLQVTFPVVVE